MLGVMCGIDAVGYEARDVRDTAHERPNQVIEDLIRVVNPTGRIGVVGVYFTSDPGAVDKNAGKGVLQVPLGELFEKSISLGTGQTPVKRYNELLRDLIIDGHAKPSFIVTQRLPLRSAPDAYEKFDRRLEGYTKVVLKPELAGV